MRLCVLAHAVRIAWINDWNVRTREESRARASGEQTHRNGLCTRDSFMGQETYELKISIPVFTCALVERSFTFREIDALRISRSALLLGQWVGRF